MHMLVFCCAHAHFFLLGREREGEHEEWGWEDSPFGSLTSSAAGTSLARRHLNGRRNNARRCWGRGRGRQRSGQCGSRSAPSPPTAAATAPGATAAAAASAAAIPAVAAIRPARLPPPTSAVTLRRIPAIIALPAPRPVFARLPDQTYARGYNLAGAGRN